MNIVKPKQFVLDTKIGYKNKSAMRQITDQDDTMVYIPILESMQQLLSNSAIFQLVTQKQHCKEGVFYDICDGQCNKTKPIFQEHPDALQVVLYHD